MKSRIVDFLLKNHVFSALATFGVLLVAIGTTSLPLLFLSGIMAYGWPFFYVFLLDVKENPATEVKAPAKELFSVRPGTVGVH